jgi:hypothetical protein
MSGPTFLDSLREHGFLDKPTPANVIPLRDPGAITGGYVDTALNAEAGRVLAATPGTRNHTLNRAAFSLGQLVAGGVLDEQTVRDRLTVAAHAAGLEARETDNTITSGLRSGAEHPRGIPEPTNAVPPIAPFDPTAEVEQALRDFVTTHLQRLDWHALWADDSEEEWIVEPLLPARRLVALYSAPKLGKSLLMLEIAVAICTGRPVLGATIDRPRRVLYVDFENDPRADIRERLIAMRVGPDDLERLDYLSFPSLPALDSARGGITLMAAISHYASEVVVVDTVSRAIAGEENENDTWLGFYRHTGLLLKQAGVSLVRLDHSGKDETKGQRGGSAKSGDVDAVWRLSRITDESYRLDCEAARMPIVEKTLVLHRELYPLRHRVDAEGRAAAGRIKVEAVVKALEEAGAARDITNTEARDLLRGMGVKAGNSAIAEALKKRRLPFPDGPGTDLETTRSRMLGERSGTED